MAKVRVNGIEIDGQRVVINGRPLAGSRDEPAPPTASRPPPPAAPPPSAPPLVAFARPVGVLSVITGCVALLFAAFGDTPAGLRAGGALVFAGLGALIYGVIGTRQANAARQAARASEAAAAQRAILVQLEAAPGPLTLEAIADGLALPPERLVRAMQSLIDAGRVAEDLDLQTGDFEYRLCPRPRVEFAGSIADQIDRMATRR